MNTLFKLNNYVIIDLFEKLKIEILKHQIKVIVFTSNKEQIKKYKDLGITNLLSKSTSASTIILELLNIINEEKINEKEELEKDIYDLLTKLSQKFGYELIKK